VTVLTRAPLRRGDRIGRVARMVCTGPQRLRRSEMFLVFRSGWGGFGGRNERRTV